MGHKAPCSGEGRSGARPDLVSEAWALDRPPALFSKVEENLRRRLHDSLHRQALPETMQGRGAGTSLVACRRVTITSLLASKLSWPVAAKSYSPSNSIQIASSTGDDAGSGSRNQPSGLSQSNHY